MFNKLVEINNYYNSFTYISDKVRFNQKDYWQTPKEFEFNKCGDCEDFAIAKFFKLKENNIASNVVYCVTVDNQPHMICIVGDYILDNIIKDIVDIKKSTYRFIYAFNTDYWKNFVNNVLVGSRRDIDNLKLWRELIIRFKGDLC